MLVTDAEPDLEQRRKELSIRVVKEGTELWKKHLEHDRINKLKEQQEVS